ncbi:MAG TPA: hypothetical protein G4O03_03675 [Dehalococcoidia bacterium]|nr:hypothetical protein [Dehalococcoidia bacterium]
MNLTEMRTRLRRDLHDEDANNYRWTDDELDRHIGRAVRELSLAAPREAKATLTTTAGSRELSIASLSDLVNIEAVEYPAGKYPALYVRFSLWGDTLTLLTDRVPGDGEAVYVYYGKMHTLDATSSTIPPHLEELVATGAAAYAAIEWSSYATNRVNLGGEDTWRGYLTWGQERLSAFLKGLAEQGRKNAVRVRQLYRPYEPKPSQSTDWGPGG